MNFGTNTHLQYNERESNVRNLFSIAYLVYNGSTAVQVALPDLPSPLDIRATKFFTDSQVREFSYSPLLPETAPAAVERIVLWQSESYCVTGGCALEYWLMNNVSFAFPSTPPLISTYFNTQSQVSIPFKNLRNEIASYQNVTYAPITFNLTTGQVYEVVLV